MRLKNEYSLMVDLQLMKITGVHRLLQMSGGKIFGYNNFQCIKMIIIAFTVGFSIIMLANAYYFMRDKNEVLKYAMVYLFGLTSMLDLYTIIESADALCSCVQLTSTDCFSYTRHDKRTLENGKGKSKRFATLNNLYWLTCVVFWSLTPLFLKNNFVRVTAENNSTYFYRYNIINLVFPASTRFYNEHFIAFYVFELSLTSIWAYCTMMFEMLIISICITLLYQFRTVFESYTAFDFGFERTHEKNTLMDGSGEESKYLHGFKILIQDQQKVIGNMRNFYKIIQPIVIYRILIDSMLVICASSITIMNYINGSSLISLLCIRFIGVTSICILHLYIICYLFSHVDQQKDKLNFAMYSCDWMDKSIRFKKLLLYSMQMNTADNFKFKITRNQIVNFEMFMGIMRTTYSILSLLANNLKSNT